jgi:hypothetical protein
VRRGRAKALPGRGWRPSDPMSQRCRRPPPCARVTASTSSSGLSSPRTCRHTALSSSAMSSTRHAVGAHACQGRGRGLLELDATAGRAGVGRTGEPGGGGAAGAGLQEMDLQLEVHRLDLCLFHRGGLKMENAAGENEDQIALLVEIVDRTLLATMRIKPIHKCIVQINRLY